MIRIRIRNRISDSTSSKNWTQGTRKSMMNEEDQINHRGVANDYMRKRSFCCFFFACFFVCWHRAMYKINIEIRFNDDDDRISPLSKSLVGHLCYVHYISVSLTTLHYVAIESNQELNKSLKVMAQLLLIFGPNLIILFLAGVKP